MAHGLCRGLHSFAATRPAEPSSETHIFGEVTIDGSEWTVNSALNTLNCLGNKFVSPNFRFQGNLDSRQNSLLVWDTVVGRFVPLQRTV